MLTLRRLCLFTTGFNSFAFSFSPIFSSVAGEDDRFSARVKVKCYDHKCVPAHGNWSPQLYGARRLVTQLYCHTVHADQSPSYTCTQTSHPVIRARRLVTQLYVNADQSPQLYGARRLVTPVIRCTQTGHPSYTVIQDSRLLQSLVREIKT